MFNYMFWFLFYLSYTYINKDLFPRGKR
ncbi:MAG: hypothetical protein PWQ81_1163, partial [Bacteroidota bacterium]|nr:hypothetical protein [Bacteroidota bacterium]